MNKEIPLTDLNINSAQCIRAESGIGETVYHNICNGATNTIPWGAADWVAFYSLVGFVGIISLLFLFMIGAMIKMMCEY